MMPGTGAFRPYEDFQEDGLANEEIREPGPLPFLDDVLEKDPTELSAILRRQLNNAGDSLDDQNGENYEDEGSLCSVKTLYEGPGSTAFNIHWVEEYPDDLLKNSKDKRERRSHAILVKHRKKQTLEVSGRDFRSWSLCLYSIRIRSKLLKEVLKFVLKDYPGLTLELKKVQFIRPFQPFVHQWDVLERIVDQQNDNMKEANLPKFDKESIKLAKLLYDVLYPELRKSLSTLKDLTGHGVITFDYLWALFKPYDIVVDKMDPQVTLHKFKEGRYEYDGGGRRTSYLVTSSYVDWDGEKFGYHTCVLQITNFDGSRPINSLVVYPLSYHEAPAELRRTCIQRGRKFEILSGLKYKSYKGVVRTPIRKEVFQSRAEGRIIIDCKGYLQNKGRHLGLSDLPDSSMDEQFYYKNLWIDEMISPLHNRNSLGQIVDKDWQGVSKIDVPRLSEESLMLCHTILRGYCLTTRMWTLFNLENVSGIRWNDQAFPNLVLPSEHKDLLLALISTQLRCNDNFDDVIAGKGQGVIMLLSGGPGIGKTLTAEAIAEEQRTPLYYLSAGELGWSSAEIEVRLDDVLSLATRWNAILLLDEAEVFLQERDMTNLERNRVVAIFLRKLEYYKGVMFLTTNRVASIDAAFESRIHMTFHYPNLTTAARKVIWKNLIHKSAKIRDEDLLHLAEEPLNGRQIRNVVKAAWLLADKDQRPLGMNDLKTIIRIIQGQASWNSD